MTLSCKQMNTLRYLASLDGPATAQDVSGVGKAGSGASLASMEGRGLIKVIIVITAKGREAAA